jgi:hypothetical protein
MVVSFGVVAISCKRQDERGNNREVDFAGDF